MKTKTIYSSEHQEQKALVNWFRLTYPNYLLVAVPNGGNRDLIEAKKLKDEGVLKGFPDLICVADKKSFFIEMKKKKGGVLSKEQIRVHQLLMNLGYTVLVGYGFIDAKNKIEEVLK